MQTVKTNLMEAHDQWRNRPQDERFETLEALAASVHSRRARSRATDIETSVLHAQIDDGKRLVINSKIEPCEPSHWSFGQLATAIKAPASYLRTLPDGLALDNINHGLKSVPAGELKFMTIAPDDSAEWGTPNILQAVTSTTYGRIWDSECVQGVQRIVESSGGKWHNPLAYSNGFGSPPRPSGLYASDHDCFMFMIDGGSLLEAGPRAELNRGFICWNSETGARTYGLMTFIFNRVCGNHIIWGAQDVNKLIIRHSAGGPQRFVQDAMPTLRAYAEASPAPMIDTVRKAQDYLLPGKALTGDEYGKAMFTWANTVGKFSRAEVKSALDFAKAEEGECRTLWQFIQGATAYARGFDFIDSRVDLEKRAGSLLDLVASN